MVPGRCRFARGMSAHALAVAPPALSSIVEAADDEVRSTVLARLSSIVLSRVLEPELGEEHAVKKEMTDELVSLHVCDSPGISGIEMTCSRSSTKGVFGRSEAGRSDCARACCEPAGEDARSSGDSGSVAGSR